MAGVENHFQSKYSTSLVRFLWGDPSGWQKYRQNMYEAMGVMFISVLRLHSVIPSQVPYVGSLLPKFP